MSTQIEETPLPRDARGTALAAGLAALLVVATGIGLASAVGSSSIDRVSDSTSTAPVYGAP